MQKSKSLCSFKTLGFSVNNKIKCWGDIAPISPFMF